MEAAEIGFAHSPRENHAHTVAFTMFPQRSSPFFTFLRQARLYTFAQLFTTYLHDEPFVFCFDEMTARPVYRGRGLAEKAEGTTLYDATVLRWFDQSTVFDHIVASLGIPFLAHESITLGDYPIAGQDATWQPRGEVDLNFSTMQLRNPETGTTLNPDALHTDNKRLADHVRSRVQHISSYFSAVINNAQSGVSHRHYVKFLLDAFPGRIRTRHLPPSYTELKPLQKEAERHDETDDWRSLADDLRQTVRGLDRDLTPKERAFAVSVLLQATRQDDVVLATRLVEEDAEWFAANRSGLVKKTVDAQRLLRGNDQIYNTYDERQRERLSAEAILHDSL